MINIDRLMDDLTELAKIGRSPGGGITRRCFSREDREARNWLVDKFKSCGLTVNIDPAGNITGRLEGRGPSVVCGSHIDTIVDGGMYDGSLGVLGALECVRTIKEKGYDVSSPIEVISFTDEEERFIGFLGSYAFTGQIDTELVIKARDESGISLIEAMASFGFNLRELPKAARKKEDIKAFIELHVEQGPILEKRGVPVGIVECVKGNYRYRLTARGRRNHAGFPMTGRKDAFAILFSLLNRTFKARAEIGNEDTLMTVGVFEVEPGLENVISGHAYCSLDFRDKDQGVLDLIEAELKRGAEELNNKYGVDIDIETILKIAPVYFDQNINAVVRSSAEELGIEWISLQSGAGHDAQVLGLSFPSAMIFVPSHEGLSHCPEEHTSRDDIEKGVNVLFNTLLKLAR